MASWVVRALDLSRRCLPWRVLTAAALLCSFSIFFTPNRIMPGLDSFVLMLRLVPRHALLLSGGIACE